MSLVLTKCKSLNLSKHSRSLNKVRVCLGWKFSTGKKYDLDATAFGLFYVDEKPQVVSEDWVIYYNQDTSPNGAIIHSGDDRCGGDGNSANEIITVTLDKIHFKITEISFVVTIDEALKLGQTFGDVKCFIQLVDDETNEEICRYELDEEFSNEISVQFGSLYKENNEWYFKAIGAGSRKTLADYCVAYGASVA